MVICNTAVPWRHFQKPVRFLACARSRTWHASEPLLTTPSTRNRINASGKHGSRTPPRIARSDGSQSARQTRRGYTDVSPAGGAFTSRRAVLSSSRRRISTSPTQHDRLWSDTSSFCTILASSPQATSLDELIDKLPSFEIDDDTGSRPLLVFLVTRSYAQVAAADDSGVFRKVLDRISDGADYEIETLVAVVDKLPQPPARPSVTDTSVEDLGAEGMAFISTTVPRTTDATSSKLKRKVITTLSDVTEQATLSFDLSAPVLDVERTNASNPLPPRTYTIQLPLTNTIFQNGMRHTLMNCCHQKSTTGALRKLWSRHHEHYNVRLPLEVTAESEQSLQVKFPLVPLTPLRKVSACIGNIIRKLELNGEVSPASQELESAVSAYLKARALEPQTVAVWALIVPAEDDGSTANFLTEASSAEDVRSSWLVKQPIMLGNDSRIMSKILQHDAKVRRVMSGGGGWGKKAGLLSLDPSTSYDTFSDELNETFQTMLTPESLTDESSPLGSVAQPGDWIQFFINPPDNAEAATGDSMVPQRSSRYSSSVEFGVVPSTVDFAAEEQPGDASKAQQVSIFPGHIGMLSEGGMAVSVMNQTAKNETKVDVPFSRFSIRTTAAGGLGTDDAVSHTRDPEISQDAQFSKTRKVKAMLEEGARLTPSSRTRLDGTTLHTRTTQAPKARYRKIRLETMESPSHVDARLSDDSLSDNALKRSLSKRVDSVNETSSLDSSSESSSPFKIRMYSTTHKHAFWSPSDLTPNQQDKADHHVVGISSATKQSIGHTDRARREDAGRTVQKTPYRRLGSLNTEPTTVEQKELAPVGKSSLGSSSPVRRVPKIWSPSNVPAFQSTGRWAGHEPDTDSTDRAKPENAGVAIRKISHDFGVPIRKHDPVNRDDIEHTTELPAFRKLAMEKSFRLKPVAPRTPMRLINVTLSRSQMRHARRRTRSHLHGVRNRKTRSRESVQKALRGRARSRKELREARFGAVKGKLEQRSMQEDRAMHGQARSSGLWYKKAATQSGSLRRSVEGLLSPRKDTW